MSRGVFLEQIFPRKLAEFSLWRLVAVNFMVNIVVCYSRIGSFDFRTINSCKCVVRWILCHYWPLRKSFGCFEGNFENSGRMKMFSEKVI